MSIFDCWDNRTDPTKTPSAADILREKLAGGHPIEIERAAKELIAAKIDARNLFTTDISMLSALGSRIARAKSPLELNEILSALGPILSKIMEVKENAAGHTLASETLQFAASYKTPPSQLRVTLSAFTTLGADLSKADSQLTGHSYTVTAVKAVLQAVTQAPYRE